MVEANNPRPTVDKVMQVMKDYIENGGDYSILDQKYKSLGRLRGNIGDRLAKVVKELGII